MFCVDSSSTQWVVHRGSSASVSTMSFIYMTINFFVLRERVASAHRNADPYVVHTRLAYSLGTRLGLFLSHVPVASFLRGGSKRLFILWGETHFIIHHYHS